MDLVTPNHGVMIHTKEPHSSPLYSLHQLTVRFTCVVVNVVTISHIVLETALVMRIDIRIIGKILDKDFDCK